MLRIGASTERSGVRQLRKADFFVRDSRRRAVKTDRREPIWTKRLPGPRAVELGDFWLAICGMRRLGKLRRRSLTAADESPTA